MPTPAHPALSGQLDTLSRWPSDAAEAQRAAYVRLLLRHDWSHEFSDDHSKYERGRRQLAELRSVQRAIDPTFEVWNAHAPAVCRDGASYA
jgi:hypothetical protein